MNGVGASQGWGSAVVSRGTLRARETGRAAASPSLDQVGFKQWWVGRCDRGRPASQARIVASQVVTFVYRSHCVHLNFLKPIWLACSLKHLLQIMSSYFLMRPSWLVQTRQARESLPYFLGCECCWWGIFLQVFRV